VLLEAIRHVSGDFRLDVVGSLTVEPRYAREMQKKVNDIGYRSKIFFHGILNGEPLAEILRTSQVLVIPSFYEGFGISFLEGMAFGLPSIGTRAGAIPQLVKDGENGFVIDPGDPKALATCLMKLAADRELLARLSLHALSHFQSQPTWAQCAESVRSFLSQILNRPG
jgi:glycosyltransferase involved in cell wall biosynthesis